MASSGLRKSNFVTVMAPKQRTNIWRKRVVDVDTTYDREAIGSPVLVETTLQKDFIDKLPDVQSANAAEPKSSDTRSPPSTSPLDPKLMKDLPIIAVEPDDDDIDPRMRPVSEVPTASSVYTRPSPELPYEFDPASQVAPLFSGTSNPAVESTPTSQPPDEIPQDIPPYIEDDYYNYSTHQPTFNERARLAGVTPLGLDTHSSSRYMWQGASGQTRQLTPITATPVTMSGAGSISPIDSKEDQEYFPYHPSDEQPTPKAEEQPTKPSVELPSTPKMSSDSQRPSGEIPYSSPNSGYRQPQVSRFSWTTYATEPATPKHLVANTPNTNRSADSWTSQSPPQYYYRTQQLDEPNNPGDIATTATEDRAQPDVRNSRPNRDSYGRAVTYPGVRYVTHSQPQSPPEMPQPTTIQSSPQSNIDEPAAPPKRISPIMTRAHPMAALTKPAIKPPSQTITNPKSTARSKMTIKRKPTPSTTTMESFQTAAMDTSALMPADKDKSLPNTPATLSSIDHITLLQSELSSLALKKHNLVKRISHLNELFSPAAMPNPMILDLSRRRETKAQISQLETELFEVHRQQRDTGLRLMRAQRRRDQEAPTALWVRRVTSVSD